MVAANGFVSLLADLEVTPLGAAGPLAEPTGVAVTAMLLMLRIGRSTARSVLLPIESVLLAAIALIVVPAIAALVMGGGGAAFLELGHDATSAFTLVDALLAGAAGLVGLLVVRARSAGAGRPRWPWERDDEP